MRRPGPDPKSTFIPAPGEVWTPINLTRWSGAYLQEKGVVGGRLEAELILAHVLGVKRLDLYLQFDRPIRPPELESFKSLLLRRRSREPLQYVLGSTEFRDLKLHTDPRALIPRPETEVLVGEVLAWVGDRGAQLRGLDFAQIREAVGEYLTDTEIEAVLLRRDLILKDVDERIAEMGEDKVLY